ncbi:lipopolysaccharide heptosyltransferase II [Candidatus Thioglobus sp.]|nr:lipopolysaccharide heptosyltransferase II [Candidatus Thioglobus sp.]
MKLLIELPTWLGDTVMTSPAIESLVSHFNDVKITLIGSSLAVQVLKNHPKVVNTYILDKTNISLFRVLKNLTGFDVFISFRGSLRSKYLKLFISAKRKFQFDKKKYHRGHQVEKYNNFINDSFNIKSLPGKLVLNNFKKNINKKNKVLGINAGASFGDAKRWHPKEFANVASALSNNYDILIFGSNQEWDIANDIEKNLIEMRVTNYLNLATNTSISELIIQISNLDLFITGDTGPMHIAAAFNIPTVAVFGPTNSNETSPWGNEKSIIVKKDLECQPCMQRTCPLGHHNCMKLIKAPEVLRAIALIN